MARILIYAGLYKSGIDYLIKADMLIQAAITAVCLSELGCVGEELQTSKLLTTVALSLDAELATEAFILIYLACDLESYAKYIVKQRSWDYLTDNKLFLDLPNLKNINFKILVDEKNFKEIVKLTIDLLKFEHLDVTVKLYDTIQEYQHAVESLKKLQL